MKKLLKKKLTVVFLSILSVLVLALIVLDLVFEHSSFEKTTSLMNTVVSVSIEGKDSEKTGEDVLQEIAKLETYSLSRHIESTSVSKLNAGAGNYVKSEQDIISLAKRCQELNSKTHGAFNTLLGNVSDLWGFGTKHAAIPDERKLKSAVQKAAKGKISVKDGAVKIPEGTAFDLGSVGKGIACDEAKKILASSKVKRAVVSVGGSVLLYGEKQSFNVGVRNPFKGAADVVGKLSLSDASVSTSGSYERYFYEKGKAYHHIINPKSGYPAENDLISVTVISNDGFLSDALSTACFVLGYEDSLEILKEYNAQALFIFKDKSIKATDKAKQCFTLTDDSFKLV